MIHCFGNKAAATNRRIVLKTFWYFVAQHSFWLALVFVRLVSEPAGSRKIILIFICSLKVGEVSLSGSQSEAEPPNKELISELVCLAVAARSSALLMEI